MTGAQKRAALVGLADRADRHGLEIVGAALLWIAGKPLDDAIICEKWRRSCDDDRDAATRDEHMDIMRAATLVLAAENTLIQETGELAPLDGDAADYLAALSSGMR